MRAWSRFTFTIIALALAAGLLAACGGDDDDDDATAEPTPTATATATQPSGGGASGDGAAGAIAVGLTEWAVQPGAESVGAGSVTFAVSNDGAVPHEFLVIRTDLAPDALPKNGGAVDEGALDVVGKSEELLGGESEDVTAELTPGSYVLICNISGHYDLGMRIAFTVE